MRIVITGGTRGIGFALAEEFLNLGNTVCICGTTIDTVTPAIEKLRHDGRNAYGMPCDVSSKKQLLEFRDFAQRVMGSIDIWINNAGIGQAMVPVCDLSEDRMKSILDVNIAGAIFGSTAAAEAMIKQGYGTIYNMEGFGSDGKIRFGLSIYGTTKRAIRYFSKAFGKELSDTPIRVGTLSPGMVLTEFLTNPLAQMSPEDSARAKKVFSILADKPEIVARFLVSRILSNRKKHPAVNWLPGYKVFYRFLTAGFRISKA